MEHQNNNGQVVRTVGHRAENTETNAEDDMAKTCAYHEKVVQRGFWQVGRLGEGWVGDLPGSSAQSPLASRAGSHRKKVQLTASPEALGAELPISRLAKAFRN